MVNSCSQNSSTLELNSKANSPHSLLYLKCVSIGRTWIDNIKINENGNWCPPECDCEFNQLWSNLAVERVISAELSAPTPLLLSRPVFTHMSRHAISAPAEMTHQSSSSANDGSSLMHSALPSRAQMPDAQPEMLKVFWAH